MAWIESHQGLSKHPKTKKLIRKLGIPGPHIIGHLHYLWWWALDFAQDGEITQFDAFDIADACEWKDDPNDLFLALVDAGFIDKKDDRYFIHDWHDYAGKLIEIRKKDAVRKRKSRGIKEESHGHPTDIHRTSEGRRTESIRDLDLDLNPNLNNQEEEEEEGPKTALDAYYFSFKKFSYTGQIQGYVVELMNRGFTDAFIREIFMEMGERGIGSDVNYMKKLAEDWISKKIYTRIEAKRRKELQVVKGGQTNAKHGTGHDGRTNAELNLLSL
jgi:hypothetical protein